jgi:hypothetical protein
VDRIEGRRRGVRVGRLERRLCVFAGLGELDLAGLPLLFQLLVGSAPTCGERELADRRFERRPGHLRGNPERLAFWQLQTVTVE